MSIRKVTKFILQLLLFRNNYHTGILAFLSLQDKQHVIDDLNAKIAELRQEVKQLKDSRREETADSEVVLELQSHLSAANEETNELKEMLKEAGEAFTEKEAEISKLRAALDGQEACFKNQVRAV